MANKQINKHLKKGFTLFETLVSIVILAIVMLTIPKIHEILDKNHNFSSREDGIYLNNSLIKYISLLNWDEHNSNYNDIIITSNGNPNLNCNTNRINSFINSRKCLKTLGNNTIGIDPGELTISDYDDVDDWNNNTTNIVWNGTNTYEIKTNVSWFDDVNIFNYDYGNNTINIDLSNQVPGANNTNIKKINTYTLGKDKFNNDIVLGNENYYSANIGKVVIESKKW